MFMREKWGDKDGEIKYLYKGILRSEKSIKKVVLKIH